MTLAVENLCVGVRRGREVKQLVRGVSFALAEDECLGILGESGSGKSLTCAAINGLLDDRFVVSGSVRFQGRELFAMKAEERRRLRGSRICMIMQSPMTAFDPLFTIGSQLLETLHLHTDKGDANILRLMADAFEEIGLAEPQEIFAKYPHELSGGMLQRIMIALTTVLEPALIIADEPTTAIDYVNQQEVVQELQKMRRRHRTALIFISHDLSLVAHIADRVLVMNGGEAVEQGPCREVFAAPQSDYTAFLLGTRMKLVRNFLAITGNRGGADAA